MTTNTNMSEATTLTRDSIDQHIKDIRDGGRFDPYEEGVILTDPATARVFTDLMRDACRGVRVSFDGDGSSETGLDSPDAFAWEDDVSRYRSYDGIPVYPVLPSAADEGTASFVVVNKHDIMEASLGGVEA